MSILSSLSPETSRLSAGLEGEVILLGQPRFDDARRAFNLAADQEAAFLDAIGVSRIDALGFSLDGISSNRARAVDPRQCPVSGTAPSAAAYPVAIKSRVRTRSHADASRRSEILA